MTVMRITLTKDCHIDGKQHRAGESVEVGEQLAASLSAAGYAALSGGAETETATAEPAPERAVHTRRRKPRRG